MPRPEVFLSHASADKEAVKAVALQLKQRAIPTWLDEWNLVPGQPWVDAVGHALRECSGCIVFLGPSGAGPWHHEEVRSALNLAVRESSYRLIPVLLPGAQRERLSQLPGFLTNRTWVEFSSGLDEPDAIHRLVCGIRGIEPGPLAGTTYALGRNPYRGLRVFDVDDAPLFFGREVLTQELIAKLEISGSGGARFISIVGPSGSGKSSLARAGLLASLRAGGLPGSGQWPQIIIRPGQHPLESLAVGVVSKLAPSIDPSELIRRLKAGEEALHRQVKVALQDRPDLRVVLLVDQVEEVFTLGARDDERAAFFANLVYAATIQAGQTLVALAFRSDFYSRFAEYQQLAPLVSESQLLVPPMSEADLRRAIAWPAERSGRPLRSALVDELLSDAKGRPGCLPLLEHALAQLWERPESVLGVEEYQAIGGLTGALNSRAEALFASLTPSQQATCRRLYLRLVQPAEVVLDTRRRVEEVELPVDQREVSQAFAAEGVHLLIWFREGDRQCLEVAHEELIRRWDRLQRWVGEDRFGQRTHRRLTAAASEWSNRASGSRDDSFLYRGAALAEVEEWLARLPEDERSNLLNSDEVAFLEHSRAARDRARLDQDRRIREAEELAAKTEALRAAEQQRRRDAETFARRLRYGLGAAVAMALLAAGAGAIAIVNENKAQRQQKAALSLQLIAVANSLSNLAGLYFQQGQYDRARPLYEQALATREAALGNAHPDFAMALDNLANLYFQQGQYDQAKPLYAQALAIREAALGKSHPDVAQSLNSMANLYSCQGQYGRSEAMHQRALAIREGSLGQEHPDVAQSLNGLAALYSQLGQYDRAEPLYGRALAIREATLGQEHPDVAQFLGLADLLRQKGQLDDAVPLYERALAIHGVALGKGRPELAASLDNLATLHSQQGLYERAELLYYRALAIREDALGKEHPDVAASLDHLATLHLQQGLYDRAKPLYERALAIREATLGQEHPDVGASLDHLATLHLQQGLYDRAESLYERALAIREQTLGKAHPDIAATLNHMGVLRVRQSRLDEATPLFSRAFAISEGRIRWETLDFAESRLASLLGLLGQDEKRLYALVRAHPDRSDVRRLAFTAALLFKGRSVEEAANTSRISRRSMGPQDREAFERLRGLRSQFAKLSLDGPGQLGSVEYQQRLKRLEDEGDAIEADLAKRSAPLRSLTGLPSAADVLERVAVALPRDSVLVEFVAYEDVPLAPMPGTPESKLPKQARFLAFVLSPDGHTAVVDLGPSDAVDKATLRVRDALATRDSAFQAAAQELYQLAFSPLLPTIGNARKIFLVPDGQLSLVPFAALHSGRDFLVDTYDFTYLTSGRDLLPRPDDDPASTSIVVLADPDYSISLPAPSVDGAERGYATASGPRWLPLPGTRQEAEAIKRIFPQTQIFLGAEASKERLFQLKAPGILHIATHGFFLRDLTSTAGSRALGTSLRPLDYLPDPLLRSGLALAGASALVVPDGGSASSSIDSLVTALELASLDLWGTQLVVLSACDTGRGEVGQGIYGLRRAFVIAGAETVVVSLWAVDDEGTADLMESYYRNLRTGQGRATALRQAMLSLRARYPHPFYWAPFITVGRDAPLRGFKRDDVYVMPP